MQVLYSREGIRHQGGFMWGLEVDSSYQKVDFHSEEKEKFAISPFFLAGVVEGKCICFRYIAMGINPFTLN